VFIISTELAKREKLSPRSVEALKRLGITTQELRYISMKQLKRQPDSAGMPLEILKIRWNHLEEKRIEKILMANHERQ